MSDLGHAFGAAPQNASGQPYGQDPPYAQHDPHVQDEVDNLVAAHAQARSLAEGGDLTGARSLIEEALASGELRLGGDDQRLAPLMVDLATIARRLGNLTEARNQLRRAYAIIVAAAGPEHASSLSIEGRLAAVIYRLGEPTEAYDWHLVDAGRRVLGTDHPAVRGAQSRLAATAQPPPMAESPNWTTDSQGWATQPAAPAPPADRYAPVADGVYQRQADIEVIPPPPLTAQDVQVWPEPPLSSDEVTVRQRKGRGGGLAIVASIAAVILVAGIVVAMQLFRPDGGPAAPGPVSKPSTITVPANPLPTAATPTTSQPPTRVLLKDEGGAVTLTWDDPSAGKVPFIVSGAREGNALLAMASVPAGQTTSTIYGLNINYNYCFTVSAVWSSENIQASIRTCTFRLSTTRAS
jgi:Tetratricopeptide repeat